VMLTAKGEFASHTYWQSLGIAGTILKPFDPLMLVIQLNSYLGW
jgi:hypothetical protein